MGKSLLADLPGPHAGPIITNASVASGGANGVLGRWVAPHNLRLLSAWRVTEADEATHGTASTSASYRRTRVLNGGPSGTATTILASLNQTASQAAQGSKAFTMASNPSASAGDILVIDQLTVGGADNDGTVVAAGSTQLAYEML